MSERDFSWKRIIIPAFGPSALMGIGKGAILPVIALSAMDLNASLAESGLIVALIGFGSLICNIPAAMITSRYGERLSLVGASVFFVLALLLCLIASHPLMLAAGVLLIGMATSVFYLARQSYLIDAVPKHMHARAFSTLGGTQRMGMFIGPFAAAGLMHFIGLAGAYWVAVVALIAAGLLSWKLPELELPPSEADTTAAKAPIPGAIPTQPRMMDVALAHKNSLLTLGLGVLLIGAMRSTRQIAIPLWAAHIGLSPTATAIIFGLVSAMDMLVFYPAGKVMDQFGRLWVALPCALLLGMSLAAIPLTQSIGSFVIVCLLMGLGNGIGSGIVMTLGADSAPRVGRTQFLGLWRLIADIGNCAGPFILSGVTAAVSLGSGIATIGVFGFAAAAIFWRTLPLRPSLSKPAPVKQPDALPDQQ
ncbi:MAG: MFS transporter [Burkholderiaceae bacterium]|nr:MFS transporter [Burkholderiaceae bacterium]